MGLEDHLRPRKDIYVKSWRSGYYDAKIQERDREQVIQHKQQREVQLLQNDPEYLELVARDKLDLMKDGETIFRLQGAKAEPVPSPAVALPPK